jgi:RNA methyltransferase, TrmH family
MSLSKNKLQEIRGLQQKKFRDQTGLFLVEGLRLAEEALSSSVAIESVLYSDQAMPPRLRHLLEQTKERGIPLHITTPPTLAKLCTTETPQPILAIVKKNIPEQPIWPQLQDELILALDHLQDPGNLGAVLRTADWFGVKSVFISRDSVELYNPKVVRATMGAIFRLHCYEEMDMLSTLAQLRNNGYRIHAAVVENGAALAPTQTKSVLLIGNEAQGLSPDLLAPTDVPFTIARLGRGESLNAAAAAGIALYEMTKR